MKISIYFLLLCQVITSTSAFEPGWKPLFDGKSLVGWNENVYPGSFSIVDGAIKAQSVKDRVHLFYVGDQGEDFVHFTNFELKMTVKGEDRSNSGVFFHTDYAVRDKKNHLANGYEVQLNSTEREKRKTGSLYAIVDFTESIVDDTEWFSLYIKVEGKNILVKINDKVTVDYTEPDNPERPANRKGRLLKASGGAIALQAHDPDSVWYFKDIYIRELE